MRRVGKWALWALGALVVLAVIGALFGDEEDDPGDEQAAKPTATATPTPTPTPKPKVTVVFNGPYSTTSDSVVLRGRVTPKDATVRVRGATVKRSGRKWTAEVAIRHHDDNTYRVTAAMPGHVPDQTKAVVTRELSEAEIAAREAAERDEFIAESQSIPYNQLEKNPKRYKGTKVVMRGQIFQIQEDSGTTFMLLSVTDEGYGFWTDNVWIDYDGTIEGAEEDIITVYGVVKGSVSYETQAGGETYVPRVKAEYVVE